MYVCACVCEQFIRHKTHPKPFFFSKRQILRKQLVYFLFYFLFFVESKYFLRIFLYLQKKSCFYIF